MELLITVDRADGDLARTSGRGARPLQPTSDRPGANRRTHLRPGDLDAVRRHRGSEPPDVSDRDIYYSMERNMQCAVGLCGHCQLGPAFLCKDGPVFAHRELAPFFRQEMF